MLTPCEVAVKSVMPSIRAFIAKELVQTYKMKQSDVGKILGITQTAVSKYTRLVRGTVLKIDDSDQIRSVMQQITHQIIEQKLGEQDLAVELCQVCKLVRKNGIMCPLCKLTDPAMDVAGCQVCKLESSGCQSQA